VHELKLFRRTVVGVVTGQEDNINPAPRMGVYFIDDAAQIEVVLQTRFGDMQIADMQESQRLLVDRIRHGSALKRGARGRDVRPRSG
jgi:hypothetical protein